MLGPMTSTVPNPGLTAPDELAGDIQFPTLDESLFNTEPMEIDLGSKDDDPLNWTTQMQSDPLSIEIDRGAAEELPTLYEDDLGDMIDIGLEEDIETVRDAPPARPVEDDRIEEVPKLFDDDLGLNLDDDEPLPPRDSPELGELPMPDDDIDMEIDQTEPAFNLQQPQASDDPGLELNSQSTLSPVPPSEDQGPAEPSMNDESAQASRQPVAKKRKVLPTDTETTISASLIKQQQSDRSAILKPLSLLPKDPLLLTLMTMQQSGGFVSSIMGDDRTKGLAPQLHGLLSLESIRKAGSHKRKRDSGVADLGQDGDQQIIDLNIEIPPGDDTVAPDEAVADLSKDDPSTILHIPGQSELPDDDDLPQLFPEGEGFHDFDETAPPILNLEEQGPMSVGTQHAVHVLRDYFGGSAEAASSKKGALFQDLYLENRTTKAEATKMFFETLVLATKDAVKVEQSSTELGAPIRIRPKRNLWGEWAEREAGGEIASNENNLAVS